MTDVLLAMPPVEEVLLPAAAVLSRADDGDGLLDDDGVVDAVDPVSYDLPHAASAAATASTSASFLMEVSPADDGACILGVPAARAA
jgi:hypothetical protein